MDTEERQEKLSFRKKGNRCLRWSDEEEDWETLGFGVSEEMGRPGGSKDLGSGGTEESGRPGESKDRRGSGLEGSTREMPVRKSGSGYEGFLRVVQLRVADWHQTNLYMRALASPIPSARTEPKSGVLSISYAALLSKVTSNFRCSLLTGGVHLLSHRLLILSLG